MWVYLAVAGVEQQNLDGIGVYGEVFHYGMACALIGSAMLIFFYLWNKGKLDMDEEAKIQMHEMDEYTPVQKQQPPKRDNSHGQ